MLLDRVKTALRISHSQLDDEINNTIEAARSELNRAGCLNADIDDSLVQETILTYCLMRFGSDKDYQRYFDSWQYQLDNLRKTSSYSE